MTQATPAVRCGVATRPLPGFRDNGDSYLVEQRDGVWFAAVIDGLGHGSDAADAAYLTRQILQQEWPAGPDTVLRSCHTALLDTRSRGAVVGAVWADHAEQRQTYEGVGNIDGIIAGVADTRRLTSIGGFLGGPAFRVHPFAYTFCVGDLIIMHSDGVSARFDIGAYAGLTAQEPDLIARVLLRDWARPMDDATVLVGLYQGDAEGAAA